MTESYNDSEDIPEKEFPVCTLRSFPYLIDHVIEWARDEFFGIFVQTSKFLKDHFENPEKSILNIKK